MESRYKKNKNHIKSVVNLASNTLHTQISFLSSISC